MGKGCRTTHRLLCQPIQDNIRRCCAMTNWNEVSNSSAARRMIRVAPPTAIGTLPRQCGGSCARAVPDTTSRAKEGAGVQSVCALRAGARANSGSGRPDPLAVRPTWDSFSLTSRSFVPTASAPGPRESGTEEKSPVTNGLTGARHESLYAIGNSLCVSLSAGFVASIEPTAEQIKNQTGCMIVTDRGRSSGCCIAVITAQGGKAAVRPCQLPLVRRASPLGLQSDRTRLQSDQQVQVLRHALREANQALTTVHSSCVQFRLVGSIENRPYHLERIL